MVKFVIGIVCGIFLGALLMPQLKMGSRVSAGQTYTLYQQNYDNPEMYSRIHLATFDAYHVMKTATGNDPTSYNKERCELFRDLFKAGAAHANKQVTVFCEPGRYSPGAH